MTVTIRGGLNGEVFKDLCEEQERLFRAECARLRWCQVERVTDSSTYEFLDITLRLHAHLERWTEEDREQVAAAILDWFEPFAVETGAWVMQLNLLGRLQPAQAAQHFQRNL
jgi:hypothetical protein